VDVDAINVALHRLVSLGLLRMQSQNVWIDCVPTAVATLDQLSEPVTSALHKHSGANWTRTIRSVASHARSLSSTTVAVHSRSVPKAIELLARCRRQLLDLLQEQPADEIYQLEMSLYPITAFTHPAQPIRRE
jgi:hypothetical protein